MALRDRMAVSAAPIFLRIGLGVTFLWAGLGKILSDVAVQGQNAAILANMGVYVGTAVPIEPKRVEPVVTPPTAPEVKEPPTSEPSTGVPASEPAPKPAEKSATDKSVKSLDGKKSNRPPALMALAAPQTAPAVPHTMAEYPEPRLVKRVNDIAVRLWKGGHPEPTTDGKSKPAIVPAWASSGSWPVRLAWACAITETLGGTLLLVGLFTRLSALFIAFNMGAAIWLVVIGPAIQSGDTMLGFLPRHARFDTEAWKTPLWLLSLLTSAIALFFAGPGMASLDSVIFGSEPEPQPKAKSAE